jgi:rubrerythrin
MKIGLEQVGAHYAISSIFRNYPEDGELFCFGVHRESHEVFASGRGKVAIGRAAIRSRITEETEDICFAVLHLGDQNLSAAVKQYTDEDATAFDGFSTDVRNAIRKANLPEVIRLIDRFFTTPDRFFTTPDRSFTPVVTPGATHVTLDPATLQPGTAEVQADEPGGTNIVAHGAQPAPVLEEESAPTAYSLTSLFADEQHRILQTILNQTIDEMEHSLRKIYEDHASLLHFLTESGMTPPPALALASTFAINASLRRAIEAEEFDSALIEDLVARAATDQRMKRAMVRLEAAAAGEHSAANALHAALDIANTIRTLPFEVTIWQAQNIWNDLLRRVDANYWSDEWKDGFKQLGEAMNIAVDQLVIEEGVSAF